MRRTLMLLAAVLFVATARTGLAVEGGETWDLPRSIGQIFLAVYGTNAHFSATASSVVQQAGLNQAHAQHMQYFFKGGKFTARYEVPLTRDGSKMAMTYIFLRELNKAYLLAAGPEGSKLDGFCPVPLPAGAGTNAPLPKVEKKAVGPQTVAGHPCSIQHAVATLADGSKLDVLLWEAIDLHRFPIRVQSELDGAPVTTTFEDVKIERQPESLFDVGKLSPHAQWYENPQDMLTEMNESLRRWHKSNRRELDKQLSK